jgi:hypothetical protein
MLAIARVITASHRSYIETTSLSPSETPCVSTIVFSCVIELIYNTISTQIPVELPNGTKGLKHLSVFQWTVSDTQFSLLQTLLWPSLRKYFVLK